MESFDDRLERLKQVKQHWLRAYAKAISEAPLDDRPPMDFGGHFAYVDKAPNMYKMTPEEIAKFDIRISMRDVLSGLNESAPAQA